MYIQPSHHAFCGCGGSFVSQQEPPAVLEQIGDVLDVELELVEEDLERMQDSVWLGDLELCQFTIEADILAICTISAGGR